MARRLVAFATNRIYEPSTNKFGFVPETPASRLWLGTAMVQASPDPLVEGVAEMPVVDGVDDLAKGPEAVGSGAGVITGWLARAQARDAVPLLIVHGFAYTFMEALARGGDLCAFLEMEKGFRVEPLAFSWPSNGMLSLGAYQDDQKDAAESADALARLFDAVAQAARRHEGRPPCYLAHSMGARMTRFAVAVWAKRTKKPPADPLFAQAFVMAGDDDRDVLDADGPMRPITKLARWTTVGVYPQDSTLTVLSAKLQKQGKRLGAAGPLKPLDPKDGLAVVDYVYAVADKPEAVGTTDWNYLNHQYYRNDLRVRQDMVAAMQQDLPPESVPGRRWGQPNMEIAASQREDAHRLYVV